MSRHRTDELVPASGMYWAYHEEHRLVRTVRLHQGDRFPRCPVCSVNVEFSYMAEVEQDPAELPFRLYEVPLRELVADEDKDDVEEAGD